MGRRMEPEKNQHFQRKQVLFKVFLNNEASFVKVFLIMKTSFVIVS